MFRVQGLGLRVYGLVEASDVLGFCGLEDPKSGASQGLGVLGI